MLSHLNASHLPKKHLRRVQICEKLKINVAVYFKVLFSCQCKAIYVRKMTTLIEGLSFPRNFVQNIRVQYIQRPGIY